MPSSLCSIATFQKRVAEMLPSLREAEAEVLGLLSFGILTLDGGGLTRLSNGLAKIEQVPVGRLRQRLREFYYEAGAKRGKKRREVKVEACFADLLRAVLRGWEGKKELALAMDASTLGERFTVLSKSRVYRGCGIPIAWKIIRATQEGSWRPHWEGLLASLAGVVPSDWKVIMMADRGLYAAWLYGAIKQLGWHPMLRVKEDLSFREVSEETFSPMGTRVKRRGRGWMGKGEWSEHGERVTGTVLIRWEKGYAEKLVIVTDLDEKEANAAWYQMRFWIEDEYKDHKSGGWGWEQTKMTDPGRAERQWLARAVAMLVAVLVGGEEEACEQEQQCKKARPRRGKRRGGRPAKPIQRPRAREQSVLMRGQQRIQAAVIRGEEIPQGHVVVQVWPKQTYRVGKPTKSWVIKSREKEAKKRYQKNKQTHAHQKDERSPQERVLEPENQQESCLPAKQLRQHERKKEAQEAKRKLKEERRENRKQEQEEQRAQRQREREERKQEKEQKRERRLRAQEEREQERLRRRQWHEEVRQSREQRLARKLERMQRRGQICPPNPSVVSRIVAHDQALASQPDPP